MEIYVVGPGDTVESVATIFEVEADMIIEDNQLTPPYRLADGQALLINNGITNRDLVLRSSGYLYPFIDQTVLQNTLPYLSTMNIFAYGFTADGELVPPEQNQNEEQLIISGLEDVVVSILTLAPLDRRGRFNNELISELLNNTYAQDALFENLLNTMQEKGYVGINLDFEYVKAEDRDAYTSFVRDCVDAVKGRGFQVSVALPPKTSDDQEGLLYEGIDYRGLGEAADTVILMTYEWGYTYGPPMAVAPLNKVREVVEYATSVISPAKIMLGIPNYGYDWELPYEEGVTQAESIGLIEAVQRAVANSARIRFDETAQSPYYTYQIGREEHEVWFEDVRSIRGKFDLIKEFGMRGATYWQLMTFFRANWLLMEDNFFILPGL